MTGGCPYDVSRDRASRRIGSQGGRVAGAGKTILVGAIIATEFALALEYPDSGFTENARSGPAGSRHRSGFGRGTIGMTARPGPYIRSRH
jgi:hypothetical protein